nr:PREDICTED: ATP-dependent RNA helicase DDX51 [Latimeria chalumnae]|eukprot:XP_014344699.1 PREDICTED: ATP-dependent RNA helicase DDX51 [Latimeria chalumnae]
MALFLINRYLGDEEGASDAADGSRSQALLARLQEQARARQQEKQRASTSEKPKVNEAGTVSAENSQDREADLEPKMRKEKRKRQSSGLESPAAGKRIKKRKMATDGDSERGELNESTESKGLKQGDAEDCSLQAGGAESNALGQEKRKPRRQKGKKLKKLQHQSTDSLRETLPGSPLRKRKLQGKPLGGNTERVQDDGNGTAEAEVDQREEEEEEDGKAEDKEEEGNGEDPVEGSKLNEEKPLSQSTLTILGGFEKKVKQKVLRVLPHWLAQPKLVHKDIKQNLVLIHQVPGIHPRLLKKLEGNGIRSFFPVQAEVIPAILESARHGLLVGRGGYRPSDLCVSAPTGSGKTLAFVIPIVQVLMQRVVCQVRALVVLPTKELAQQVCKVFNIYTDGSGLKVVMVAGQKPFGVEQEMLVQNTICGYRSLADIVVATPGRLVDHISKTPGFSLQQLRYLVREQERERIFISESRPPLRDPGLPSKCLFHSPQGEGSFFFLSSFSACRLQTPLQKLLFSATLTQSAEKLRQLGLYLPRLFMSTSTERQCSGRVGWSASPHPPSTAVGQAESKYTLPEGLTEYYVPCVLGKKPLILLHFILRMKFTRVLCFTNTRETSHRLFLLVRAFGGVEVAEFSSRLRSSERQKTLKEFEQGKLQILITTDATARGIDIKGVKCVINYDAPQFIRTYIHRVGRTARAGKAGLAFSMLLRVQEKNFLQMLKDAGSSELRKQFVKEEYLRPLIPRYEETLKEVQRLVKDEREQKRF